MVGAAGIEPATLCLEGRCSIRLSYAPAFRELQMDATSLPSGWSSLPDTHHDSPNLRSIGPRYVRTPRLRRSAHYLWLSSCSGNPSPNRPRYVNTSHGTVGTDVRQQVTFSNLQNFDINATPPLAFSEYLPDRSPLRKVRNQSLQDAFIFAFSSL
jgi:hypothetical protein